MRRALQGLCDIATLKVNGRQHETLGLKGLVNGEYGWQGCGHEPNATCCRARKPVTLGNNQPYHLPFMQKPFFGKDGLIF